MAGERQTYLENTKRRPELLLPGQDLLGKFLSKEARSVPMFFGGRTEERNIVLQRILLAMAEFHEPALADPETAADGIILLQGPPGSGKTSLATEFGRLSWKQGFFEKIFRLGKSAPPVAMPVHILAEELADEALVTRKIALKAVESHINELEEEYPQGREINYELGCRILEAVNPCGRVEAKPREVVVRRLNWDRIELERLEDLLIVPKEKWKVPVLLVIDEIQNIRDCVRDDTPGRRLSDGEQPAKWDRARRLQVSNLLRKVQVGRHGLPMLTICSGLSDSWPTLKAAGISRPARSFSLDCLNEEDVERIASRFFKECRIDAPESLVSIWTREIVQRTNCYPMHVHNALSALGEMLKENHLRLSGIDMERWKDKEAERKREAYGYRTCSDMRRTAPIVAAAMHAMSDDRSESTSMDRFLETVNKEIENFSVEGRPHLSWVKEMNAEWLFEHLRHQGAIQNPDETSCICAIPSFRNWLNRLDRPLHRAVATRDIRKAREALKEGHKPSDRDRDGMTALEIAEAEKCLEITRLMRNAAEGQAAAAKKHKDETAVQAGGEPKLRGSSQD